MGIKIERLIQLRQTHGWTQRELARLCSFSESLIRKYEAGISEPTADSLSVLADTLGVSTDYLLGRTNTFRAVMGEGEELTDVERELLDTCRRAGWPGVFHMGADRITEKVD